MRMERGETVAQTVLAVPLLLGFLLLALQITATFHSANVANAAAVRAARAVAAAGASGSSATEVALATVRTLDATASDLPEIVIENGKVFVTVHIHVPEIFPGLGGTTSRTASAPKERFVSEIERINGSTR